MENHQIVAAAGTLVIGGEEFQVSPLTDKDHSELDLWCQGRIIRMARAACDGLEEEEAEQILRVAIDKATETSWVNSLKLFSSLDGAARIAWQMIKKRHNVSYKQIRDLTTAPQDILAINDVMLLMHKMENNSEEEGNAESR